MTLQSTFLGFRRRSLLLPGPANPGLQARCVASLAITTLVVGLVALLPGAVEAQTLNSENVRLLSNNCALLGGPGGPYNAALGAICTGPGGSASSAGANAGSSETTGATVENRREERLAGKPDEEKKPGLGGRWSPFISGDYESLERDVTTFEDGYDADIWRVTAGIDRLLGETLLVGAFFSYANNAGDFETGGDFETDSYSPTLFASYLPMPGVFVDLSLGYTGDEYSRDRFAEFSIDNGAITTFSGLVSSKSDGDEFNAHLLLGYDHSLGSVSIGPRVGLNYSYTSIDEYAEKGGTGLELRFEDQSVDSLQTVVGFQASMAISTPFGVVLPQLGANYVHEFTNDQRDLDVTYVGDLKANPTRFSFENEEPDRNIFNVDLGAVMVLPHGIQPYVNLRALLGHTDFDNFAATIGVRLELP